MVRKSVLALALLGGAWHLGDAAQASVADGLVSGTAPRVSQVQFAQFNPLDIPAAIVAASVRRPLFFRRLERSWLLLVRLRLL